jgi:hypothetical protein
MAAAMFSRLRHRRRRHFLLKTREILSVAPAVRPLPRPRHPRLDPLALRTLRDLHAQRDAPGRPEETRLRQVRPSTSSPPPTPGSIRYIQ